jgi:putative hydrolase of the HAD superfamily
VTQEHADVAAVRPKGLLVDFGGVLTTSVAASFRAFCARLGLPAELALETFVAAYRDEAGPDGLVQRLETGAIPAEEFERHLAAQLSARAGVEVPAERLIDALFTDVHLDEDMLGAVAAARSAGVRTGLLSNSIGRDAYPRERFAELFDAVVISGEVGLRKPDEAIYRLAAERLGVEPEACVFVDDLAVNVRAAERLGMTGLLHRAPGTTLEHLSQLFAIDFPVPTT